MKYTPVYKLQYSFIKTTTSFCKPFPLPICTEVSREHWDLLVLMQRAIQSIVRTDKLENIDHQIGRASLDYCNGFGTARQGFSHILVLIYFLQGLLQL